MPVLLTLLTLLTATPAAAHRLPDCLKLSAGAVDRSQTLAELKECQEASWEKFRAKKDEKGALPTPADLDRLDDHQRAEARRLLAESREVLDGNARHGVLQDEPDFGSKKGAVSALKPGEAPPAGAHPGELGGVTEQDLSRVDEESAADIRALQARLHAAAGDGRHGIAPAMAEDIRKTLAESQDSLSPEMQALLDAVTKDGGKLTPATMKLLQNAGREAKSEGLNLNIDKATEKELLEHDIDSDKPAAPPGDM